MIKSSLIALRFFAILTILTGIIYPLTITLVGGNLFPKKSAGSLVIIDNKVVGSELIGQGFTDSKYFWSRPSAVDYNPLPSGGSNLGPTSSVLKSMYIDRLDDKKGMPADLLFASGSGLDPHISVGAAKYQASRVASRRGLNSKLLYDLIDQTTEKRAFGVLGEERVNVLMLNMALDRMGAIYGK